nr:hypothetical protein [Tanacetum cinerariifolium]
FLRFVFEACGLCKILVVCVSTQILRFVLAVYAKFLLFVFQHKSYGLYHTGKFHLAACDISRKLNSVQNCKNLAVCAFLIILAVCAQHKSGGLCTTQILRFVHNTNLTVCVTDLAVCAFLLILAVSANFLRFVHNTNLAACVTNLAVCVTALAVLSNEDLKGTRTEHGFKRAFISLFSQDVETFTSTIFLYVDQMKNKSFLEYTRIKAKDFRDTLLKHMSSIKKSNAERAGHRRQYDRKVNAIRMQRQEGEVDRGITLEVGLIITECSGTKSNKQDTSNSSGNHTTHAVDADIRPVNDQEPFLRTELVVEGSKKDEATKGSLKRTGEELEQENTKKQKMEDDKESLKLKQCLEIVQDDGDGVTIDATPLSFKSPTIFDYKIYKEGKKNYF